MDVNAAEQVPARYRVVLDGIAELEGRGLRDEAALIRRSAIAIYSTAWDERGLARLHRLEVRIGRILSGHDRPRRRTVRRPRFGSLVRILRPDHSA
jgi:hypothetical protein